MKNQEEANLKLSVFDNFIDERTLLILKLNDNSLKYQTEQSLNNINKNYKNIISLNLFLSEDKRNFKPFFNEELSKENVIIFFNKKQVEFFDSVYLPKGEYLMEIRFDYDIKSFKKMFADRKDILEITVKINSKSLLDISYMFENCAQLAKVNLSEMFTQNVNNMEGLFKNCTNINEIIFEKTPLKNEEKEEIDIKEENVKNKETFINENKINEKNNEEEDDFFKLESIIFSTENVISMKEMFSNCQKMKSFILSSFITENVKTMEEMFIGCINVENFNLSSFNTKNVNNMKCMFYQCQKNSSLDLHNFSDKSLKDISLMFGNNSNLNYLNITNFTKNNLDYSTTFIGCLKLNNIEICSKKRGFNYKYYLQKVGIVVQDIKYISKQTGQYILNGAIYAGIIITAPISIPILSLRYFIIRELLKAFFEILESDG